MAHETVSEVADSVAAGNGDADAEVRRIREAFDVNRSKMTVQLARELGVTELAVVRALPDGLARELDVARWEELLRALEPLGQVHVVATNGACTLEAFGQFGNFSTWGDYFNVQSKTIDMHIRFKELAGIFAVEKPSHMDGVNTLSIQFFDRRGAAAFKVFLTFGGKAPAPERLAQFAGIRETFALR